MNNINNIIVGLDLGSSFVRTVIGEVLEGGKIEIIGNSNVFLKNAIGVTVHLENGLSRQISGRNLLINNDILEEMIWQE